jgi:hypothetical protein
MSSEPNQFVDVANLRMLDRILTKAGFEQIYAVGGKKISATSFLTQCLRIGIIDEATLKSALRVCLATTNAIVRLLSEVEGSLARWQDEGGAPGRIRRQHTRLWLRDELPRHGDPVAVALRAVINLVQAATVSPSSAGGRLTPWNTITGSSTISECIPKRGTERSK